MMRSLFTGVACVMMSVASATTVLPVNLARMTELADVAYVVRIESVETTQSGKYAVDKVQGVVTEPVLGDGQTSQPVQWQQLRFSQNMIIPGMPVYVPGQEYLVFLSGKSVESGCQMPVGLQQGAFSVIRGAGGAALVRNDLGNATIAAGLDVPRVARDMAAQEMVTRGRSAAATESREVQLDTMLRPRRGGNSLAAIKDAVQFFDRKKRLRQSPATDYATTATQAPRMLRLH